MKLLDIVKSFDDDEIYYHGTGNVKKVIQSLKNNTFIPHKSGGVVNGMFITPNKELSIRYSELSDGEDKGVVMVKLRRKPKLKKYKNVKDQYNDETSFNPHNIKQSILMYKKSLLDDGYDGIKTGDVILIFDEKMDLIYPVETLRESNDLIPQDIFVRFGLPNKNKLGEYQNSYCYNGKSIGVMEGGISVFDGEYKDGKYYIYTYGPNLKTSFELLMQSERKLYLVDGVPTGNEGSDGDILLDPCTFKVIRIISKDKVIQLS